MRDVPERDAELAFHGFKRRKRKKDFKKRISRRQTAREKQSQWSTLHGQERVLHQAVFNVLQVVLSIVHVFGFKRKEEIWG